MSFASHHDAGSVSPLKTTTHLQNPGQRPAAAKTPPHPKKPLARRGVHTRSQSHTRTPVRLSSSATGTKPHLGRSKLSDGIVRTVRAGVSRNNRSYTKLTGLQPLTKTLLNGSYPRGLGLAPLTKTALHGSVAAPMAKTALNGSLKQYGLRKSVLNGSVKGIKKAALDHLLRSLKPSHSAKAIYGSATAGLKTSGKRGRAILKLNEDAGDNEYEDLSDALLYDGAAELRAHRVRSPEPHDVAAQSTADGPAATDEPSEPGAPHAPQTLQTQPQALQAQPEPHNQPHNLHDSPHAGGHAASISDANSSEDFSSALYGGSLLLSQSTGLTRKIGPISELPYESESSRQPDDTGLSFAPQLRQSTTESTLKTAESYQPNQSIFSNLQRTNTQFLNNMMQQRQTQAPDDKKRPASQLGLLQSDKANSAHKDFSAFLQANQTPLNTTETRTQQRLWLQRENSMLEAPPAVDVSKLQNLSNFSLNKLMFSHNYNNSSTNLRDGQNLPLSQQNTHAAPPRETPAATTPESVTSLFYLIQSGQNSIQSRTEFERLNRGYVNVRRYLNPVAESLNRLRKNLEGEFDVPKRNNKKNGYSQTANSFREYVPNWEERREEADAIINQMWQSALISSSSSTASLQLYQQEQRNHQNQALPRGSYLNTPGRSINPATRSVKLAAQAATGSQK